MNAVYHLWRKKWSLLGQGNLTSVHHGGLGIEELPFQVTREYEKKKLFKYIKRAS